MSKLPSVIDEYIAEFPDDVRKLLKQMQEAIERTAPGAEDAFSYGMPTYKLHGKNLVHFAGFKNHIGFYPTPSGVAAFAKELKAYKTSKGAIQFPLDAALPLSLIEKIVAFRVKEEGKSKKK